jgi:hypothetical protein
VPNSLSRFCSEAARLPGGANGTLKEIIGSLDYNQLRQNPLNLVNESIPLPYLREPLCITFELLAARGNKKHISTVAKS